MHIDEFRNYCLSKPGVTEDTPFDKNTLVFKVGGKMFALTGMEHYEFINLKCDPDLAIELREQFDYVKPGYHMSKTHWNSVYLNGVSPEQLKEWVDMSYDLVFKSLTKKLQAKIGLV